MAWPGSGISGSTNSSSFSNASLAERDTYLLDTYLQRDSHERLATATLLSDFGTNLSIIITIKCNICDDSQASSGQTDRQLDRQTHRCQSQLREASGAVQLRVGDPARITEAATACCECQRNYFVI